MLTYSTVTRLGRAAEVILFEGRGRNRKEIFLLDVFNSGSGMSESRSRIYFKICVDCTRATVVRFDLKQSDPTPSQGKNDLMCYVLNCRNQHLFCKYQKANGAPMSEPIFPKAHFSLLLLVCRGNY